MLKEYNLKPTKDFGYLCGLIIGDCHVGKTKRNNYRIVMKSTKLEIINMFMNITRKIGFSPSRIYEREETREFPNGIRKTNKMYTILINSKQLYDMIKPYKGNDYSCSVPKFLNTDESKVGFLQGFFDAEGSIQKNYSKQIKVGSKHIDILNEIKNILHSYGIESNICNQGDNFNILYITNGKEGRKKFHNKIGFRLPSKNNILSYIVNIEDCKV